MSQAINVYEIEQSKIFTLEAFVNRNTVHVNVPVNVRFGSNNNLMLEGISRFLNSEQLRELHYICNLKNVHIYEIDYHYKNIKLIITDGVLKYDFFNHICKRGIFKRIDINHRDEQIIIHF